MQEQQLREQEAARSRIFARAASAYKFRMEQNELEYGQQQEEQNFQSEQCFEAHFEISKQYEEAYQENEYYESDSYGNDHVQSEMVNNKGHFQEFQREIEEIPGMQDNDQNQPQVTVAQQCKETEEKFV